MAFTKFSLNFPRPLLEKQKFPRQLGFSWLLKNHKLFYFHTKTSNLISFKSPKILSYFLLFWGIFPKTGFCHLTLSDQDWISKANGHRGMCILVSKYAQSIHLWLILGWLFVLFHLLNSGSIISFWSIDCLFNFLWKLNLKHQFKIELFHHLMEVVYCLDKPLQNTDFSK